MGRLIISCDLGENESEQQTLRLLALVDAASICCGVHAGSQAKTRRTLQMAAEQQVLIGAHPGLMAAGGRGSELPTVGEFRDLLVSQLGWFMELAGELAVSVDYVKLHGSLYHAVEHDANYAEAYLEWLASLETELGVFALAGGQFAEKASAAGVRVWAEGFADRAYLKSGLLVPRSQEGAELTVEEAVVRFTRWQRSGNMETIDGAAIPLRVDTLCVHSDSADAERLLVQIRGLL